MLRGQTADRDHRGARGRRALHRLAGITLDAGMRHDDHGIVATQWEILGVVGKIERQHRPSVGAGRPQQPTAYQ